MLKSIFKGLKILVIATAAFCLAGAFLGWVFQPIRAKPEAAVAQALHQPTINMTASLTLPDGNTLYAVTVGDTDCTVLAPREGAGTMHCNDH